MKIPPALRSLTFKSAVGAYEGDGICHRARVGMTPFGVVELAEGTVSRIDYLTSVEGVRALLVPE